MFAARSSFKQQYNPAMGHDLPLAQIMIAESFAIKCIRLRFSRDKTRLGALHLWFPKRVLRRWAKGAAKI